MPATPACGYRLGLDEADERAALLVAEFIWLVMCLGTQRVRVVVGGKGRRVLRVRGVRFPVERLGPHTP